MPASANTAVLTKWMGSARENMRLRAIDVALEVVEKVVDKSPVDTGFFRAGWVCLIGVMPTGKADREPQKIEAASGPDLIPPGAAVIAEMTLKVLDLKPGDVLWIINPTVYAQRLEGGHSKQAPNGMVGLTVQEMRVKYG